MSDVPGGHLNRFKKCRKQRLQLHHKKDWTVLKADVTRINNEIVSIVDKFHNRLYKSDSQREHNLLHQRKMTEAEEITPVMTDENSQDIRCMKKKMNVLAKIETQFTLSKKQEQNFQNASLADFQISTGSRYTTRLNKALIVLLYKKWEKENIKNNLEIRLLSVTYKNAINVLTRTLGLALNIILDSTILKTNMILWLKTNIFKKNVFTSTIYDAELSTVINLIVQRLQTIDSSM